MATITAMELGASTCAVARASVRRGAVLVSAMEVLDPTAFPGSDAFSKGLRQARKALKLPRRVRAVVWGLPDGANQKDPAVAPMIAPIVGAGFRVERVVTPCNALAALARLRTPRFNAATCWLAINRDGVAIVVLRPGKLLYSNSFLWDSSFGATGSQARLLQRYSLVSVLAPELKRAMTEARSAGTPVEGIVTCGNLPDLRSLTMPLIEELDVEVETLDSLEGLSVKPGIAGQLGDAAAAIRIACAAALARGTRPWLARRPLPVLKVAAAAAAILAICAIGWIAYARLGTQNRGGETAKAGTARGAPGPTSATTNPRPVKKNVPPVTTTASPKNNSLPSVTKNPERGVASSATNKTTANKPVPNTATHKTPSTTNPSTTNASTPSSSTTNPSRTNPERPVPRPPSHVPVLAPLLKDPLPRVTGILVGDERRFATIDGGRIITIGDVIGRRTVVAIDERAVVLREPSGVQIRVGLGGKLEGVRRTPR